MDWNEAAQKCAKDPDVEQCIKAYLTVQAEAGCIAGASAASLGTATAAAPLVCSTAVPIIVNAVWKYAWPVATAVWDGATGVIEDAWNTITGGGETFNKATAIGNTYGPMQAALNAASADGMRGVTAVAAKLGFAPSTIEAGVAVGAVGGVLDQLNDLGASYRDEKPKMATGTLPKLIARMPLNDHRWSIDDVWNAALLEQPDWSGEFELHNGQGQGVRFFAPDASGNIAPERNGGQKGVRWYPSLWASIADFGPGNMPALYALANQGMQRRVAAIPGAVLDASTALAIRSMQLDQVAEAGPSKKSSALPWALGALAVGAIGIVLACYRRASIRDTV